MFALNLIIAIFILLIVLYTCVSILANEIPLANRLVQLIFFIIFVLVSLNVFISWVTYYKTAEKIGVVGDAGLDGENGNDGSKGECSQECGRQIAYNTIIDNCNNILNEEVEALRGRISLKYFIEISPNDNISKIKSDIKSQLNSIIQQNYNLDNFNILVEITTDNKNIIVILLGNQTLSEEVKNEIINNDVSNRLNINYKNNQYKPHLLYEDVDINKCLSSVNDITDQPMKITNDIFLNKISQICNSENYKDTLEKDHDNKPNEYKLINYLKNIIGEWVKLLIKFKLKNNDTNKVVYIGLNFLLTEKATLDSLTKYKITEKDDNGNLLKLPLLSPFIEIEKYDIWRWGTGYTNIPIVFEKCIDNYELPDDEEPEISIIYTNNYDKIWNSQSRKDKWYSSSTYCPFNQLGDNNENPNNVKECAYFNTNDIGNRHLYDKQETFKSIQYGKLDKLTIYHPKNDNGIYYKDDKGRIYYPVGSIWSGKMDDSERENMNKFGPASKNKCSGNNSIGPEKETILVTGNVKAPDQYLPIWNSKNGCSECQEDDNEVTLWKAIPPDGYVALGHVATKGKIDPNKLDNPMIMCLPKSCVIEIPLGPKVWDADDMFKLDMSRDNTFDVVDLAKLYFYNLLLEDQFASIDNFNAYIDNQITSENIKFKNDNKNIHQVNIDKLNNLKDDEYFVTWPTIKRDLKEKLKDFSKSCARIEEKYLDRYKLLTTKSIKDIIAMDDVYPQKPLVTLSDNVYIYSNGANGAKEESFYKDNINISDDGGHNLFMAFTEKLTNDNPINGYRLNKECLHGKKAKPIDIPTVPGILNAMSPNRDIRKQAIHLFTYPQTIIIENIISENSPTFEPKRYYISYANKTTKITKNKNSKELVEVPLYIIRTTNNTDENTIDYSNSKNIDNNGKIYDDDINVNNPNCLWIITEYDTPWTSNDFQNPVMKSNKNNIFRQINLQSSGYSKDNQKTYFAQVYNSFGISTEFSVTDGSYNRWIYKPV